MKSRKGFYFLCFTLIVLLMAILLVNSSGTAGSLGSRGRFSGAEAVEVTGDVTLSRKGSSYILKSGMPLESGDKVLVGRGASCRIAAGDVLEACLDTDCIFRLEKVSAGQFVCRVEEGAAFFHCEKDAAAGRASVNAGDSCIHPYPGTSFSAEVYPGSAGINVYAGTAELDVNREMTLLSETDHAALIGESGETELSVTPVIVSELRTFLLEQLTARDGLCYEPSLLAEILEGRGVANVSVPTAAAEERRTCTLEIRCDTVAEQAAAVLSGTAKEGELFSSSSVKFTRGESVYDVLRRVCRTAGISLEYKFTEINQGYYVLEIGNLRERAWGPNSGWLYQVNGWYPNFISSQYEVNEGDVIVWAYTCDGGADLGREDWTGLD